MDLMYPLLGVVIIAAIIAIGAKRRTSEIRKPYQCLTSHMTWGDDGQADDRIKCILSERAARLEGQQPAENGDEANRLRAETRYLSSETTLLGSVSKE